MAWAARDFGWAGTPPCLAVPRSLLRENSASARRFGDTERYRPAQKSAFELGFCGKSLLWRTAEIGFEAGGADECFANQAGQPSLG